MYIPEDVVKEIKEKANVVEVIGRFVELKKKGKDYTGLCPFHNEKSPSFHVSPANGIWKCFGCNKGGVDSISFLMDKENLDYVEALKWLANFYNIIIPENVRQPGNNLPKVNTIQNGVRGKSRKDKSNIENTTEHNNPSMEAKAPDVRRHKGDFFKSTLRSIGLTNDQNKVFVKWLNKASQSEEVPLLTEDSNGNIEFLVYDINSFVVTYEKQDKGQRRDVPYKVVRLKEPVLDAKGKMMKYYIPKGVGTRPFFPPNLIEKFQSQTKINTLFLTEGYKKAISGWVNGLDIVGLTSISTYTDKATMQLHRDIVDLILACQVENVVILYDGDCRNISQKSLDDGKDIYIRPNNFFSSARGIKELLKDYLKDHEISLYFCHINSDTVEGHPKGLDDLYEALITSNYNSLLLEGDGNMQKGHKIAMAKKQARETVINDLLAFSKPGIYFTKINITFGFQKLLQHLAIDSVNTFYHFHQERILDKTFIYNGTQYKYIADKNECEIIIPAAAKNYIRVGDDYYEKVKVPNKYKDLELQLHRRAKTTISDDHGKNFLNHIHKFKAFCNVPDHVNYQEVIYSCHNMYARFEWEPEEGDCTTTIKFIEHIFEEHIELGLDYIQLLYQRPTQILPILCLVSKENKTGKSTFAKWLKEIFKQNMSIVGNAELSSDFNGAYATKLIVCCDEAFIDKKTVVERIKSLSTADRITLNQKGKDHVEVEFFGKFLMLSNNEDNFIYANEEDIRYWVRKIKRIRSENVHLLRDMILEIPAFLHFLNQRKMSTQHESRMWYNESLLVTDALRRVVAHSKSTVEKEIRTKLQAMFEDFCENIIYMTVNDVRKEFFNNRYEERYVLDILREHMKIEQYWEPGPAPESGKPLSKLYKTKRYKFPKWHCQYQDGGTKQEMIRIDVSGNGRPFVFLRPDFVPAERELIMDHDPEMILLANTVPDWYWKEGMIGERPGIPVQSDTVGDLPF